MCLLSPMLVSVYRNGRSTINRNILERLTGHRARVQETNVMVEALKWRTVLINMADLYQI